MLPGGSRLEEAKVFGWVEGAGLGRWPEGLPLQSGPLPPETKSPQRATFPTSTRHTQRRQGREGVASFSQEPGCREGQGSGRQLPQMQESRAVPGIRPPKTRGHSPIISSCFPRMCKPNSLCKTRLHGSRTCGGGWGGRDPMLPIGPWVGIWSVSAGLPLGPAWEVSSGQGPPQGHRFMT